MSNFKVTLVGPQGKKIVFEASAQVGESRGTNYDSYNMVQMPVDLLAYRNTSSRKFGVTGKFISRNPKEANINSDYVDLLRAWILPDFGGTGATPPILKFSAYGNHNINKLQVVIKSYSISYPDEVDYIFGEGCNDPMPVIMTVSIELEEIYSAQQVTERTWTILNRADDYDGIGLPAGKPSGSLTEVGGIAKSLTGPLSGITGTISNVKSVISTATNALNTVRQVSSVAQGIINNPIGSAFSIASNTGIVNDVIKSGTNFAKGFGKANDVEANLASLDAKQSTKLPSNSTQTSTILSDANFKRDKVLDAPDIIST